MEVNKCPFSMFSFLPDQQWIHPCRCRGSSKWVHQDCLQRWIDEKHRLDPSGVESVSICPSKSTWKSCDL
ncbi:unnamed protein product [Hymenolepis diminuta]|uniref:RING-CH-type domain-containing protein n=1 Tax=Hymenolepis diminuta TaxID=6216 RepID=A0A3P7A4H4_HYMDI|nr:unnamed protein product [Hymenolepis diminuta]